MSVDMTGAHHVRYTKWDGSLHWHFDAFDIGDDEHGRWLALPAGSEYRRGSEPARVDEYGFVYLAPRDRWWSAYFNAVPRGSDGSLIYVDINTAPTWNGPTVDLIDLDLDVTLGADGVVRLLDEDEFLVHSSRFGYPPDVVDRTRAAAAGVYAAIERGDEPFAAAGFLRLAISLGWVQASVVSGHGAASGRNRDERFPNGTLQLQAPFFAAAGIDLGSFHPGTLNLDAPFRLDPTEPRVRLEHLEWKPGYPAETFEFFDATIVADGTEYEGLVYRPDPSTKPDFAQPSNVIEVLAPYIPDVAPGSTVSLRVDPTQAQFVG
jgi:hypothetical protein